MKKVITPLVFSIVPAVSLFAQEKREPVRTKQAIIDSLCVHIIEADTIKDMLITQTGFNMFSQKQIATYLTGTSDLSLAKFFGTYSADDKNISFGINLPLDNKGNYRVSWLFNPYVEANLKNSFATLYENGKWKNDVKLGGKITWFAPITKLNFWGKGTKLDQKTDFQRLRTKTYESLENEWHNEQDNKFKSDTLLDGTILRPRIKSDTLIKSEFKAERKETFAKIGNAEIAFLEKNQAYTIFQTMWLSFWGSVPIFETDKYITANYTQAFTDKKFHLWEMNLQGTYLVDWQKCGTLFGSVWAKCYQNNSANANLMSVVDYIQYAQLPTSDPASLAMIENDKGYVGNYRQFISTTINLQAVYMFPMRKTLIKPGLSFRYELNFGVYQPQNIRIGVPLTIQGSEKPINFELQVRLNDLSNYNNTPGYHVKPTLGVSVGVPFVLLYK